MPMRRIGRPGLIGLAARAAVVAGTASAVGGAMSRQQQERAQSEYEKKQYATAQQQAQIDMAAKDAAARYSDPPAAPAVEEDLIAKLKQLASLKDSGVLTDAEFAAAKQKILSSWNPQQATGNTAVTRKTNE